MTNDESRELLEAVHRFPCEFTIKVIGRNEDDFVDRLLETVRAALARDDCPHSLRETAGGRHVAVTLEPWFESADQVLDVYKAIRTTDGLVVLM